MFKALIGGGSVAVVEGVNSLPVSEIAKVVIQLIIGAVSLIHLFKKPKKENTNQENK